MLELVRKGLEVSDLREGWTLSRPTHRFISPLIEGGVFSVRDVKLKYFTIGNEKHKSIMFTVSATRQPFPMWLCGGWASMFSESAVSFFCPSHLISLVLGRHSNVCALLYSPSFQSRNRSLNFMSGMRHVWLRPNHW
jgi:hypothetical protein